MRKITFASMVLVVTLGACEATEPEEERFTASLSGANEVPAVATPATGTAEFTVHADGTISFTLDVANLSAIIAAHIHGPAPRTSNARVLVSLFPLTNTPTPTGTVTGRLQEGRFSAAQISGITMDSLLVLMRNGQSYVNVHTTTRQAGEIRGQIEPRR